jgi:hypothetical protein
MADELGLLGLHEQNEDKEQGAILFASFLASGV